MKKAWLIGLALLVGLAATGFTFGHMWGPSMLYSGWMSSRPMGRGMTGPAMMMGSGRCPMMGYGYRSYSDTYSSEPLTTEEATTIARDYVFYSGNPNLKVGEIKELEYEFEIEIVTKSNSRVGEILIDKQTGQIRLGRGMMGSRMMMGRGMMGSGWCPMMGYGYRSYSDTYSLEPLTKEEATTIARNYVLYSGMPNLKVGEIKELKHEFEVKIVTKSNSRVGKILIDKQTGQIRPIY